MGTNGHIALDITTLTLGEAAEAERQSGLSHAAYDEGPGEPDASGNVRSRIAELRAAAELARAIEPIATRRLILDFALPSDGPSAKSSG